MAGAHDDVYADFDDDGGEHSSFAAAMADRGGMRQEGGGFQRREMFLEAVVVDRREFYGGKASGLGIVFDESDMPQ